MGSDEPQIYRSINNIDKDLLHVIGDGAPTQVPAGLRWPFVSNSITIKSLFEEPFIKIATLSPPGIRGDYK